jgi:cytochrome c556
MKLLTTAVATCAACLVFAAPASAQFQKPEDAIHYRQSAMAVMGEHFGRIGAMANNKAPFDAKTAAESAEVVAFMSKLPFAGFIAGTEKGHDTKAKPEIWKEADKFKAAATKMQEEVVKLNTAAQGGNFDQIKAAFGEAGKSCKACHDDFRNK